MQRPVFSIKTGLMQFKKYTIPDTGVLGVGEGLYIPDQVLKMGDSGGLRISTRNYMTSNRQEEEEKVVQWCLVA